MVGADADLAASLSVALSQDRIEPFFQPIVSIDDRRIRGLEVLARWRDPGRGMIEPAEFIPVADRFGLLNPLLDRLMRASFAAARTWPHNIFLGFNVSPTQLHDPELPARIAAASAEHGFPLSRVHIEVTESALLQDLTRSQRTLDKLISMGCLIAMDDFGTGYSSLTWLSVLPFSKLKIDRSFVAAMETHRQSRKIVAAVIGLGHSLNLAVVAEGVETEAQCALLQRMGCKLAQGFLLGRPSSAAEAGQLFDRESGTEARFEQSAAGSAELRAFQMDDLYRSDETAIAVTDTTGWILDSSGGFDQMMDTAPAGSAGRHISDLITLTPDMVAELRADNLLGEPFPAFEDQTPSGGEALVMIRPVSDETGEQLGYSVVCLDITGRQPISIIDDPDRPQAITATGILDTEASDFFDAIVELAAEALGAPAASISVVGADRHTFWSRYGMSRMKEHSREIPLERSVARFVVLTGQQLVVDDARRDPVLNNHPAVLDGSLSAYLGMPLTSSTGHTIGALSVADFQPRHWGPGHVEILSALAEKVTARIFGMDKATGTHL